MPAVAGNMSFLNNEIHKFFQTNNKEVAIFIKFVSLEAYTERVN
jgi:hypothetical protein